MKKKIIKYLSVILILFISELFTVQPLYAIYYENNKTTIFADENKTRTWTMGLQLEYDGIEDDFYEGKAYDSVYVNTETGEMLYIPDRWTHGATFLKWHNNTIFINKGYVAQPDYVMPVENFISLILSGYISDDRYDVWNEQLRTMTLLNETSGRIESNTSAFLLRTELLGHYNIINKGEMIYRATQRYADTFNPQVASYFDTGLPHRCFLFDDRSIVNVHNTGYISINNSEEWRTDDLEESLTNKKNMKYMTLISGILSHEAITSITNENVFIIDDVYAGIHAYNYGGEYDFDIKKRFNKNVKLPDFNTYSGITINNKAGGDFNIRTFTTSYEDLITFYQLESHPWYLYPAGVDGGLFQYDLTLNPGFRHSEEAEEYCDAVRTGGQYRPRNFREFNSGIFIDNAKLYFTNEGNFTITSYNAGIKFNNHMLNKKPQSVAYINNSGILNINTVYEEEKSSIILSMHDDTFINTGTLNLSHGIDGADGIDTFNLGSDRIDSFDKNITNFEIINKYDSGTWNLGGEITGALAINLQQGELNLNGTLKVSAPLQITGNPNLNGSVILDINETDAGILSFSDQANINNANLIVQLQQDITVEPKWKKTILTAKNVNRQFASYEIDAVNLQRDDFILAYYLDRITLTQKDPNILSLCAALNPSENIASLIGNFKKGINSEPTNQLIEKIYSLKEDKEICQALQSLSPETLVSSIAGAKVNVSSHLKNISARLDYYHINAQPQNKLAQLASDYFGILNLNDPGAPPNSLWIRQTYSKTEQDADNQHIGFDTSGLGISVGKDYLVGNILLGISGGYSNSEIEYQNGFASGDITTYNISAYASYIANKYYIDAILTYSDHNYDIIRRLLLGGLLDPAKADWQASEYGAYIETGYKIPFKNNMLLTPMINMKYSDYSQDPFVETESIANLEIAEATYNSIIAGVGFTLEKSFNYKNWILRPYASFMFEHNFEDPVNSIQAKLLSMPANFQSVSATGYDSGANKYTIGLGIRTYTQKNLQIYFDYDLIIEKNALSHELGLGLKFYF